MDENRWKLWVFKKYFDDLNVIMNATKAGIKFVEGKAEGKLIQNDTITEY